MQHLAGYFEDVDQAAAFGAIAAMPDQSLSTAGDNITVPLNMNMLQAVAILTAATTVTAAQLRSPSLRQRAQFDIQPIVLAANFAVPPALSHLEGNPLALAVNEDIQCWTNTDHAAAIEIYGLMWLSDGPPVQANGEIFTVRCTAAITLADGAWTNGNLTFTQNLPVGNYQVVGMRAVSDNLLAARLVFPGGLWRPGVPGSNLFGDLDDLRWRYGASGVLGEFHTSTPPTLDAVGVTDSAEEVFLDLIRLG